MKTEQEQERKHHPYSPSTLQSLEACPCYEGNQGTVHIRALEGTKAHKVTETGEDDHTLSDDDAEAAAECLDFFMQRKQLMEEARQQAINSVADKLDDVTMAIFGNKNTEQSEACVAERFPEITELKETYLPVDDEIISEWFDMPEPTRARQLFQFTGTTGGYFDRAIIDHTGKYCEAFDWKFGQWAIEKCSNNLQAIAYVLGLFKKFPRLESIRFFFKQPALQLVSEHTFHRSEIPALLLRVKTVVARARVARSRGDFGTANPVIPACLFCRHVGVCPKVTDFACKVGSKFAPLKIPASITPSEVQDPQNTKLGMQLAQVVKVWSEAYRSVTADRVLRGAPLPDDYELRERDGSREVINEEKFMAMAINAGLTSDEYNAIRKTSIGAVEKAIGSKQERGSKKTAIQAFKQALEAAGDIVERGRPAVFLQAKNSKD